ncbi:MAG: AraC family transcriptional regulator [Christensenellaceae bacterium]|jgi:AraC-like DNA-binding protein|nr:AraC family transcriptional regulator [Christensenellaceae bacterium]
MTPLIENYYYESEMPEILLNYRLSQKIIETCDFVICYADDYDRAGFTPKYTKLPPIIVVGHEKSASYISNILENGVFDYLSSPVNPGALISVLCRVERFLSRGFIWDPDYNYPYDRETAILRYIQTDDPSLIDLLCETLTQMDSSYTDPAKKRFALTKFFSNIINAIYVTKDWLSLYLSKESIFDTPVYVKNPSDMIPFFQTLFKGINSMQRTKVCEISNYVLRNPENDLSLPIVAGLFYYNPSYLSYRFKNYTGEHYNSYVVFVKLCRADFLMRYKHLGISMVSMRLDYTDSKHFATLYKKFESPFANISLRSTSTIES